MRHCGSCPQICRHRSRVVNQTRLLLLSLLLLLGPLPPSTRRRGSFDEGPGRRGGEDGAPATVVVAAGGLALALAANLDLDNQPISYDDDDIDKDNLSDNEIPDVDKSPTVTVFHLLT